MDELVACVNEVCVSPRGAWKAQASSEESDLEEEDESCLDSEEDDDDDDDDDEQQEEDPSWQVVRELERHAAALQRSGRPLDAIEMMEEALAERARAVGAVAGRDVRDEPEVAEAAERLAIAYNSLAMSQDSRALAHLLLRKADDLCAGSPPLLSARLQTLNNLACCFRRESRPRTALRLLRDALRVACDAPGAEDDPASAEGLAVTHLNLCAVLSELGRHRRAAEHAQAAVLHCQEVLLGETLRQAAAARDGGGEGGGEPAADGSAGRVAVLALAYHNLGVEEEHVGNGARAIEWYRKALRLAREHIGEDAEMTEQFRRSYREARRAATAPRATTKARAGPRGRQRR